jgi:hypothetical protein
VKVGSKRTLGALLCATAAMVGAAAVSAVPAGAIVGGTESDFSWYPYFASFTQPMGTPPSCGGSVIADSWVLTAAHCVDSAPTVSVSVPAARAGGTGQVILHPQWRAGSSSGWDGYDVALVRLAPGALAAASPVQVGSPWDPGAYAANVLATIMGTGRTFAQDPNSRRFLAADTIIRGDGYMDDIFNPWLGRDHWREQLMIGAGTTNQTVCHGDSGGPLVVHRNGRPVQVGVASFIRDSDDCHGAAGFAELAGPQLAWIASQVPAVMDRWGSCAGADGVPGHPRAAYGTFVPGHQWDGPFPWRIWCEGQPDRLGPSLAVSPSGQWQIAFQANTGVLWTRSSSGAAGPVPGWPTMWPATSPSIAALPSGGFQLAYTTSDGMLGVVSPTGVVTGLGLGLATGTSPSLAVSATGQWRIAMHANTGRLWTRSSDGTGGPVPGDRTMWPGTSPSIVALPSGGFQIAYQTSDGILATVSPTGEVTSLGLGMAAGASPSIAVSASGQWRIAFQADTGELWTRSSSGVGGPVPGRRTMRAHTSPSMVALSSGGFQIAYQTGDGILAAVSPAGDVTGLGLGLAAGSSPGIAPFPRGGWMIAFEANTGMLWRRSSSGAGEDLRLGMPMGSQV